MKGRQRVYVFAREGEEMNECNVCVRLLLFLSFCPFFFFSSER